MLARAPYASLSTAFFTGEKTDVVITVDQITVESKLFFPILLLCKLIDDADN